MQANHAGEAAPDKNFTFEELTVSTSECFGTCPIFELRINSGRTVRYNAIEYNGVSGKFYGVLPKASYKLLTELLGYLRLERLDTNYAVPWTDDQTIKVEIRYNGKIKSITDYGEWGTFGLRELYGLLFSYSDLIEWQSD